MSQDSINISVFETTEEVGIVVTPNITTVNVQKVTNTGLVKSVNGQTGDVVIPASDNNFTTALKNKLDGIAAGAEVNINADWNATSGDAEILNKPTIPAAVIVDATPTDGSENAVSSNGVFDALATKFSLPALTNGSVLFSNGTTIEQDNENFFWDDTNKRLGIGTNTPLGSVSVKGAYAAANVAPLIVQNTNPYGGTGNQYSQVWLNSSGGLMASIRNDSTFQINQNIIANYFISGQAGSQSTAIFRGPNNTGIFFPSSNSLAVTTSNTERMRITNTGEVSIGTTTTIASSKLTVESTTQGFLPPRMTNAQRLAIANPAVGLMVYCTDVVEGLYVNKSTGWAFII
jgi:hypothetical protein